MRLLAPLICCFAIALHVSDAFAAWREASTDHFLIYADDSTKEITRFAEKLERYRASMGLIYPGKPGKPSPSARMTVYAVGSGAEVRKLYGKDGKNARWVEGFYRPGAGGSIAIIGYVSASASSKANESERTLLHEYAHHYLYESATYLVPPWFTEGFAEYFSTAKFNPDGSVGVGLAAVHRRDEMFLASKVSIEELLDTRAYAARKSKAYDNFYARSWLLFHYIYSDSTRRSQLSDYLTRLNRGELELDAARAAFGDLTALDKALKKYAENRSWSYLQVSAAALTTGPVTVRELSEAEAAVLPVRIRSKCGVDEAQALEVVADAREVAGRYPDEPEVQAELAEAEFDSDNDEAAIAAADKALARNSMQMNALVQKGYAMMRMAREQNDPDGWARARHHFVEINHLEPDHPIPLAYFYLSYLREGIEPTRNAIEGLERALSLAPYDSGLRMTTAQQQINDGRYAVAIRTLQPLAYAPHASDTNPALEMLETARKQLEVATPGSAADASKDPVAESEPVAAP